MNHDGSFDRRTFLRRTGAMGTLLAAGGGATLAAGCGGGSQTAGTPSPAGTPVAGGRAVLATVDKPVNLDPADGQLYPSMQIYQNIFHSLIEVDEDFEFGPGLAQEWTQEDEKTWTFQLVDNAVFHNGEPFTAADVAYTFNRLKEHPLGIFTGAFDRVEQLGKHRARIHLSRPYGALEATLSAIVEIVNKKGVESGNPKVAPVGCGPYRLKEWVQDDHVTLERWDKFFKPGKPYLDEVVFRAIGEDGVRLTGLETGELDWIQRVPPQRMTELAKSSTIRSSPGKPYNPCMIWLNCTRPPFDDARVRQAVAWAIDRTEIRKLVWFDTAAVSATEAVSPPSPWYTGENPYESGPDLDKARALLREAGHERLEIEFVGQPSASVQIRIAQVLRSQLAKIGIDIRIQPNEVAQFFERLSKHDFDMTTSYFAPTVDPSHLYYTVCSTKAPFNFTGYSSKRADELLEQFTFSADQDARKALYPELVRTIAEDAPVIFLGNEVQNYWTRPDVAGAKTLPSMKIRVEDLWRQA
jgi:peptide/nickel transport system substrate-binding protein